jgi:SAM-dependent methyltransferase
MKPVDELLTEARERAFTGWDFSWLADRMTSEPPWDYTRIVVEFARDAPDLLDMGTGGGEWLADLPVHPRRTIATEAWPPNVGVAARRLRSLGAFLVRDEGAVDNELQAREPPRGRLPFRDGAFHLVVNRHEAFVAGEVARILRPGGVFVTQQVDNGNLDDCAALLDVDVRGASESWLPVAVAQIEAAGLDVQEACTGVERYQFGDVGALAWYLAAVTPLHREWAGFDIAANRDAFMRLDDRVRSGGTIEIRQKRLLVCARR